MLIVKMAQDAQGPPGYDGNSQGPASGTPAPQTGASPGQPEQVPVMERPLFQELVEKEPGLQVYVGALTHTLATTIEKLPGVWHRSAVILCSGIAYDMDSRIEARVKSAFETFGNYFRGKVLPGFLNKYANETLIPKVVAEVKAVIDKAAANAVDKKLKGKDISDLFKGQEFYGAVETVVNSALTGEAFHKAMEGAAQKAVAEVLKGPELYEAAQKALDSKLPGAVEKALEGQKPAQPENIDELVKKAVAAYFGPLNMNTRLNSQDGKVETAEKDAREAKASAASANSLALELQKEIEALKKAKPDSPDESS